MSMLEICLKRSAFVLGWTQRSVGGAPVLAEFVDDSGSDDRRLSIETRSSGRMD